MTVWSRLRAWLGATLRRSRTESEMDAELRFHMEAYTEDLVRGGRGWSLAESSASKKKAAKRAAGAARLRRYKA